MNGAGTSPSVSATPESTTATKPDPVAGHCRGRRPVPVDVVANYTSFQDAPDPADLMAGRDSTVTVALLFPDLLGTYGDSGNAVILAQRLRWRGIEAEVHHRAVG